MEVTEQEKVLHEQWIGPWEALFQDLLHHRQNLPIYISDAELQLQPEPSNLTIQRCFINSIHFLTEGLLPTQSINLNKTACESSGFKPDAANFKIVWRSLLHHIIGYKKGPYGNSFTHNNLTLQRLVLNGLYYSQMQVIWAYRQDKSQAIKMIEDEADAAVEIETREEVEEPILGFYQRMALECPYI